MMDRQRSRDRMARGILFGTIGLLSIGLGRVAQLQLAPAEELGRLVGDRTRTERLSGHRGNIEDRYGRILAMSTTGVNLVVDVKFLREQARETGGPEDPLPPVAQALAEFTGLDEGDVLAKLRRRENSQYVVIQPAETFSLGDGEARVREWKRQGIPGIDGEPWPVPGIILEKRQFRRTTEGSSAAALVGKTHAIAPRPSPEEYDRIPCRVVIDVPGLLRWYANGETSADDDPLLDLSQALATTLGGGVDSADIHDLLTAGSEGKVLLIAPHHLRDHRLVGRLRDISLGGRTVPRRYLMEYVDPTMLANLERHYPKLKGASGAEARFDDELSPIHGRLDRQVAPGNQTYSSDEDDYEPPRDGLDVQLSIDLDLQSYANKRLMEAIDAHHAVGGWVIVVDPNSGEILAAVDVLHNDRARARAESVPAGPETEDLLRKFLASDQRQALTLASPGLRTTAWPPESLDPARDPNGLGPAHEKPRLWTDVFAPGSTFKSFFWAWATEHGGIAPEKILDTPGPRGSEAWKRFSAPDAKGRMVSRTIRDGHAFPKSTWENALVKSLNTGMAQVALEHISPNSMEEMLERFQFRSRTGINMGDAEATAIAWKPGDPQYSYIYTHLSLSFGHEISCTPMQLVRAFCAFARPDGNVPLLTLQRRASEGSIPVPSFNAISPQTVGHIKRALEKVVESGTGQFGVKSDRYRIYGKSGTAQMIKFVEAAVRTEGDPADPEAESYEWRKIGSLGPYSTADEKRFLPSFIGAAPFEQPRIVVACGLQDPDIERGDNLLRGGQAYGGGFSAGRVVKDVIEFALEQRGVERDRPRTPSEPIASAR